MKTKILLIILVFCASILFAQTIAPKKCNTCGKPLSQCQYKGKHPNSTSVEVISSDKDQSELIGVFQFRDIIRGFKGQNNENKIKFLEIHVQSKGKTGIIISGKKSPVKAYATYNPNTKTVTISTAANKLVAPDFFSEAFSGLSDLEEIIGLPYIDFSNTTNMSGLFKSCKSLRKLDLSNFATTKVTDVSSMFFFCRAMRDIDLSHFDTRKVERMDYMFCGCNLDKLDLRNLDTRNVRSMSSMFSGFQCKTPIQFGGKFNTATVEEMDGMFQNCILPSIDLSSFNTRNVNTMQHMFDSAQLGSLNLRGFNTQNVTNMGCMFNHTSLDVVDLSSFDTRNVIRMETMFECSTLKYLILDNFITEKVKSMNGMFYGCKNMEYINLGKSFKILDQTDVYCILYMCSNNGKNCRVICTSDVKSRIINYKIPDHLKNLHKDNIPTQITWINAQSNSVM